MTTEAPKVEFALGSEVSPGRFFKSAFARNFITNGRDCKSLDYELLDNAVVNEDRNNNARNNNNFISLVNFTVENNKSTTSGRSGDNYDDDDDDDDDNDNDAAAAAAVVAEQTVLWEQPKPKEAAQPAHADANELEKLRKQCQSLRKENRRLQSAFLQNVFLQARVDTLQWQVKQVESNRQMYRSTMEQVAHFLGRAHRSLEILHAKENPKDKRRVPRSRSVHTVLHVDPSPSRGTATPPSPSTSSSPFTRAKSVTQIGSPSVTCFREFTWSVLRRNDPVHSTSPRATKPPQDLAKTVGDVSVVDNVVYREPKQTELNPDEIPPEKLSQEAFRLLRTVESLLAMREPDLARIEDTGFSTLPTTDHHRHHDASLSLPNGNLANSTTLTEANACVGCRGNVESSCGQQNDSSFVKPMPSNAEFNRNLQAFVPGVRRSPDTASWNSSSSGKTTEEEDTVALATSSNGTTSTGTPNSTLSRTAKRAEKKDSGSGKAKIKPASSPVSSAEGESGFFSISSFQEVGLPSSTTLSVTSVKGCHTEVGLPEVPLDKTRHRRWSSTPAEIQALFKQHRASFGGTSQAATESVSVCWV